MLILDGVWGWCNFIKLFKIYKNEICRFRNQKALSSFISVACKVLSCTAKVLLAKLVPLCLGFTKLTILRDGLVKTAKFTKFAILGQAKSGAANLTTCSPLLCICNQMGPRAIKSGCQRKPGKMLKMSTEGGQQNKFILTS